MWAVVKRIIKIVVTRYQILRLKCIKIDFGWGSTPESAEEAPLAGTKRTYF